MPSQVIPIRPQTFVTGETQRLTVVGCQALLVRVQLFETPDTENMRRTRRTRCIERPKMKTVLAARLPSVDPKTMVARDSYQMALHLAGFVMFSADQHRTRKNEAAIVADDRLTLKGGKPPHTVPYRTMPYRKGLVLTPQQFDELQAHRYHGEQEHQEIDHTYGSHGPLLAEKGYGNG